MQISPDKYRAQALQTVFRYLATELNLTQKVSLLTLTLSKSSANQVSQTSIDNTQKLLQEHAQAHVELTNIRRIKEAFVRMLQENHVITQQQSALYLYTPKP
jgi:Skp family chaperone for outer membrane proteins